MTPAEVEQIIERARFDRSTDLDLRSNKLYILPESIGNLSNLVSLDLRNNELCILPESIGKLTNLTKLYLDYNRLTDLPESISNLANLTLLDLDNNQLTNLTDCISNLTNLNVLNLRNNQLANLPDSIGKITNLTRLHLDRNQLANLSESIGNLGNLTSLNLVDNQLTILPESIGNLSNLETLNLENNQLAKLPGSIANLSNLITIYLNNNPLVDLSILQNLVSLKYVHFADVHLPNRYWTNFHDWKPEWLLSEDNTEIKRILIEQVGYEKICAELNAVTLDNWREYTLLKIDEVDPIYERTYEEHEDYEIIDRQPMVLLKMTCPSTAHIHILRVPPEMESAEAAITWVNQGIHPDDFAVQT
jgi:leucine-rich repeat protein SHOC2